jgi:type IV pilus assembly protein PilY1
MLHAFDAGSSSADPGTGRELLAYVPNKIIDGTARFANRLDQLTSVLYSHRFFVDLTPTIEDVYMRPRASASSRSWTSLLVGGLGGGGKGYYALDVTNPAVFTAVGAPGTVLWEFTDDDDTYPVDASGDPLTDGDGNLLTDMLGQPAKDLGYAFSQARIAMSNAENGAGGKEWIATFGNGYNSSAGIAKLFVLFVERGLDGWGAGDFVKLSTGEGARQAPDVLAGRPNGLGEPALIDVDLNGTVDRAYAGDLFGNLYRFDLAATNPRDWTVTKLFQATYDGTLATRQPITKRPYVVKHPTESGFMVVTGTQRDDRGRIAGHQEWQLCDPARRFRGAAKQSRAGARGAGRVDRSGIAGRRRADRADHRPRRRRPPHLDAAVR